MKTKLSTALARGGLLLVLAGSALTLGGTAFAAGTAAGTPVNNKATLSYSVGTVNQSDIASSPTGSTNGTGANTTFVVDNKIVHTVTTDDTAAVSSIPGQNAVVTTFRVTNTGNSTQDYVLSAANLGSGTQTIFGANLTDNFDVTLGSCTIAVGGVTRSYISNLAADGTAVVTVSCPIPTGRLNNDIAGISLTAQAANAGTAATAAVIAAQTSGTDDPTAVDIVWADAAGSDDAARDGKSSARSAYRIVTAALTVTKTFTTLCDPLNGGTDAKSVPGAYVRYTITIVNNGAASATLTQITDALSGSVDFDPDLIAGTGAGANCQANTLPLSATGSGFRLTFANRGAGYNPKYMTSSSADADGASHSSGNLSINFAQALPADATYAAGELKPTDSLTLVYQVRIK